MQKFFKDFSIAFVIVFIIASITFGIGFSLNKLPESIYKNGKPSYDYLRSITVVIYNHPIDSFYISMGTGVIIKVTDDFTYILTNKHVCSDDIKDRCTVVYNNINYKVTPIKVSNHHDVALLSLNGKLANKRAVIGFNQAYPSDSIYLVGHHLGRINIYGEGVYAGYDEIYGLIQIPTLFGNSGSGIINKKGELVGLLFAGTALDYGIVKIPIMTHGIIVDGPYLKYFLEEYINE